MRTNHWALIGGAAAVAILVTWFGVFIHPAQRMGSDPTGPGMMADIEVDLYSGRPNPHVIVDQAATAELLARVAGLSPSDRPPVPEPLGYRGLRAHVDEPDAGTVIELSGGLVTVWPPAGSVRRLADPNRDTERWLVDVISGRLDDDQVQYIHGELGR